MVLWKKKKKKKEKKNSYNWQTQLGRRQKSLAGGSLTSTLRTRWIPWVGHCHGLKSEDELASGENQSWVWNLNPLAQTTTFGQPNLKWRRLRSHSQFIFQFLVNSCVLCSLSFFNFLSQLTLTWGCLVGGHYLAFKYPAVCCRRTRKNITTNWEILSLSPSPSRRVRVLFLISHAEGVFIIFFPKSSFFFPKFPSVSLKHFSNL